MQLSRKENKLVPTLKIYDENRRLSLPSIQIFESLTQRTLETDGLTKASTPWHDVLSDTTCSESRYEDKVENNVLGEKQANCQVGMVETQCPQKQYDQAKTIHVAKQILAKIDPTGAESVSYSSLKEYVMRVYRSVGQEEFFDEADFRQGFRQLDADGDGLITLRDIILIVLQSQSAGEVPTWFKEYCRKSQAS